MKVFYTILLAAFFCSCQNRSIISAATKIPVKLLAADFLQMTSAIEHETPTPFYMCDEALYKSTKFNICKSLNKPLTPIQFYQKISPLITLLNDGHFQLFISDEVKKQLENKNPTLYFPFTVFIDGNRIYSNKNMSTDTSIRKGTEILAINNIPANVIIRKIRNRADLPSNHENFFERRLEDHFYRSLFVDINLRNNFKITFKNKTTKLRGVSEKIIEHAALDPADFSYKIINNNSSKIGYFRLNTLLYEKKPKLDSVLAVFFKMLDEQKITKLIVDIRDNLGGSTKLARSVFNYISANSYKIDIGEEYFENGKRVTVYDTSSVVPEKVSHQFRGKMILITNVKTYSSAHMMAIGFKSARMGIVIGQVSSEPLFISGEVKELIATNTKSRFYYPVSNFYLPGFKKDTVSYFVPDLAIYPTITDRINGKDIAMEMAKKQLN